MTQGTSKTADSLHPTADERRDFLDEVYDWAFAGMEGCDGNEWALYTAIVDAITSYKLNAGLVKIKAEGLKASREAIDFDDIWR